MTIFILEKEGITNVKLLLENIETLFNYISSPVEEIPLKIETNHITQLLATLHKVFTYTDL